MPNSRSITIDFLKGIAIIGVILFHCNLLPYGYLGVEIFLVIGGYLITKSLLKSFNSGTFSYGNFLLKRLSRLWPALLAVCAVSLVIGYFVMLPDNFKNLAETSAGSLTFTNNIVQYITSGDYWNQSNEFKPLMHTWYVAILMQCYLLFPLLLWLGVKLKDKTQSGGGIIILIITTLSLILFLVPTFSDAFKFYLLPTRLFEFGIGGLIALPKKEHRPLAIPALCTVLILIMAIGCDFSIKEFRLLFTVACTALLLILLEKGNHKATLAKIDSNVIVKAIAKIGMISYSLYLWHQVILGFYRYCYKYDFSVWDYLICLALSLVAGIISYHLFEKKLTALQKSSKRNLNLQAGISALFAAAIICTSVTIYHKQGILRDFPEIETYTSGPSAQSPQLYNQSAFKYDHDFDNNSHKLKVLVVGDSYGRDWINVLIESGAVANAQLSWHHEVDSALWRRSKEASVIFLANCRDYTEYSDLIPLWLSKNFWRVGYKMFGQSMGPAFVSLRYGVDNNSLTYALTPNQCSMIHREAMVFGDRFINILTPLQVRNNEVTVTTPDGKLISHDGIHLTKAGAKYLASLLKPKIMKCLEESH